MKKFLNTAPKKYLNLRHHASSSWVAAFKYNIFLYSMALLLSTFNNYLQLVTEQTPNVCKDYTRRLLTKGLQLHWKSCRTSQGFAIFHCQRFQGRSNHHDTGTTKGNKKWMLQCVLGTIWILRLYLDWEWIRSFWVRWLPSRHCLLAQFESHSGECWNWKPFVYLRLASQQLRHGHHRRRYATVHLALHLHF